MNEETVKKAALISDVLCRVVDYHNIMNATLMRSNTKKEITENIPSLDTAERKVRIAVENLIDGGALE